MAAAGVTGMTGMTGAVIFYLDKFWGERLQRLFNRVDGAHGSTFLNGFTVTLA